MKRFVSVLLTLTLLLSLAPAVSAAEPGFENFTKANSYAAGQFADVPTGAWYETNIILAYELGLAKGKSETAFAPSGSVTIAETLAFASRLHSIYLGGSGEFVQGSPWYQVYVDYAKSNGIIAESESGNGSASNGSAATTAAPYDYNATATRAQFASILAKALPSEALPAVNDIADGSIPDVPTNTDYADAVYTLYRAGILTGNDEFGTFLPSSNIQRSEVATIVARMAQEGQRRTFTLKNPALERIEAFTSDSAARAELQLALELGFSLEKLEQESINGVELAELLDELIAYAAPDKLAEWQQRHAVLRGHTEPLSRFDAMAGVYLAALTIGGDYADFMMKVDTFDRSLNHSWEHNYFSAELYDPEDMHQPKYYAGDRGDNAYLDGACYYFNMSRISNISGNYPFSYDAESNSFLPFVPPTYAECVLAIARLISSAEPERGGYTPGEADAPYLAMADERRESIRTAVTDCTAGVSGKIYYISNGGDDKNDGLSPETAWATTAPLWSGVLKSGDAVLFERGGEWYLRPPEGYDLDVASVCLEIISHLYGTVENITFGAYGEGAKPILRGDIRESSDPDFWELYSDEDGVKIWKSTQELVYVPVIVFDGGEAWADPVLPWIDGVDSYINPDGSPFVLEEGLDRDLTFVWLTDLTEQNLSATQNDKRFGYHISGSVYLRCDAGNPAELYDDVALPQSGMGFSLTTDCALYDLDMRYFSMIITNVIGDGGYIFHNLEVGWCGGFVESYNPMEDDSGIYGYQPFLGGGGIYISNPGGATVTDCYVHDSGPMATILSMHFWAESGQPKGEQLWQNFHIEGNLFERCGAPSHWADMTTFDDPETIGFLSNYLFEDNYVMNSGYGWIYEAVRQCDGLGGAAGGWMSAIENEYGASHNENIVFRNNVFYLSRYALVALRRSLMDGTDANADPIFECNTYVQLASLPLVKWERGQALYYPSESVVRDVLGDATGTLVVLGE